MITAVDHSSPTVAKMEINADEYSRLNLARVKWGQMLVSGNWWHVCPPHGNPSDATVRKARETRTSSVISIYPLSLYWRSPSATR